MKLLRELSTPSFRTKSVWGEPENLNAEGPWHTGSVLAFPSLDGNALLPAGRRNNITHSWKWRSICIQKLGLVWWKLLGSSALWIEMVKTSFSFPSVPPIESYQFRGA